MQVNYVLKYYSFKSTCFPEECISLNKIIYRIYNINEKIQTISSLSSALCIHNDKIPIINIVLDVYEYVTNVYVSYSVHKKYHKKKWENWKIIKIIIKNNSKISLAEREIACLFIHPVFRMDRFQSYYTFYYANYTQIFCTKHVRIFEKYVKILNDWYIIWYSKSYKTERSLRKEKCTGVYLKLFLGVYLIFNMRLFDEKYWFFLYIYNIYIVFSADCGLINWDFNPKFILRNI